MNRTRLLHHVILVVMTMLMASGIGILTFLIVSGNLQLNWSSNEPRESKNPLFYTPFDGKIPELRPPVGVMIENEIMSRPWQKGLGAADIVYEAPTESGITRFLALFRPDTLPEKFGPIRSARTYFLDWAHEYHSLFAHVGGNPDVLARLQKESIFNVDQFVFEKYFWRENLGKTALEHTMFSSGESMLSLIEDQDWMRVSRNRNAKRAEFPSRAWESLPEAKQLTLDFSTTLTYRVSYTYDAASERYLRSQAGKPHIDHLDEEPLSAKVVVVQRTSAWSNGDREGSISMKTIGEGAATIFYRGKVLKGTWKKEALESPTRFFDEEGREVVLEETPIWIEVLPTGNMFTYE